MNYRIDSEDWKKLQPTVGQAIDIIDSLLDKFDYRDQITIIDAMKNMFISRVHRHHESEVEKAPAKQA